MRIRLTILLLLTASMLSAQTTNSGVKPSKEWVDQKFSMFIHFGLYSVYGGVYEGEPVKRGYSEQIQSFAGIFSDWYGNTAKEFNPVEWNPDSVVALAKAAGMKSVVLTSKHHDGFCMYHSKYTDFNIVDATPYGRDLMLELAEACRRGGIGFGVYYSLIDWHYPHGYPISSHNADPLTDEHFHFNLKQVEEIMTNYGEISEIWFDMGSLTTEQSRGLYELVDRLQPNCMISGRLGNDYVDFAVMADNEYPDYKMDLPWQTAASMFDETWGYRSWQERGDVQDKVEEKVASLVDVISRGGNYLLNIGPRGDGSIVEFEQEVLHGIGDWVKANSEAVYGVEANPFNSSFVWGDVATINDAFYLYVDNVPANSKVTLNGFEGKVSNVSLLSSGSPVPFTQKNNNLEIAVSDTEFLSVIKIEFDGGYNIIPSTLVTDRVLTPANATPLFGHSSLNYYAGYKSLTGYEWAVKTPDRSVTPRIIYTESEWGRDVEISVNGVGNKVTLNPDNAVSKIHRVADNSIRFGNLYRKAGRGVFGNVEEENIAFVDVNVLSNSRGAVWQKVEDFNYNESYTEAILPRASIVFLQEIESSKAQTAAVKIGSGNGVYVVLNGEYVTAHLSPDRVKSDEEIVMLPLKKGLNQLVIKYYNGFENEFTYYIKPLKEWSVYEQKLTTVQMGKDEINRVSLKSADAKSPVSPLRMNNVKIYF